METKINKKEFDVKPGELTDDAQYMGLLLSKKGHLGEGVILFNSTLKDGRKVRATLKGELNILNSKGEKVQKAEAYLKYIKKGRDGWKQLQFEKKAYIELANHQRGEGKREKPIDIVFSMADGIKVLEDLETA